MQKPTLWYTWIHTHFRTRVCIFTPRASTTTCFRTLLIEVSQVSISQKQAFSKRLLICLQSHPLHIYTDTQAWDCHAKKLLQLLCGCKGTTKKWHLQIKVPFLCIFVFSYRIFFTAFYVVGASGIRYAPKSGVKVQLFFDICKKKVQIVVKTARF